MKVFQKKYDKVSLRIKSNYQDSNYDEVERNGK